MSHPQCVSTCCRFTSGPLRSVSMILIQLFVFVSSCPNVSSSCLQAHRPAGQWTSVPVSDLWENLSVHLSFSSDQSLLMKTSPQHYAAAAVLRCLTSIWFQPDLMSSMGKSSSTTEPSSTCLERFTEPCFIV